MPEKNEEIQARPRCGILVCSDTTARETFAAITSQCLAATRHTDQPENIDLGSVLSCEIQSVSLSDAKDALIYLTDWRWCFEEAVQGRGGAIRVRTMSGPVNTPIPFREGSLYINLLSDKIKRGNLIEGSTLLLSS